MATAVSIPAIPPPAQANMASLQSTVNQLREIMQTTTGQNGVQGQNTAPDSKNPPGGSFVILSQTVVTKRIFQNNDPTSQNWVDVQYVTNLTMQNNATKSLWV